ncbi:MAG: hypothetical protein Q8M98_02195 [Candidatus Cloacimonadaceae bacterium]|nr:hypothetical protein [Candidatus Cloacimonadaceae bacterium]MDP3113565.1 hypothetical protein [Candidatus Cloacimonadaceae bacterium]
MFKRLLFILLPIFSAIGFIMISAHPVNEAIVEDLRIDEASGIAASFKTEGILYTHNDSGGEAAVYTLNQRGLMPAKLMLFGIKNRDWEDIAVSRDPKDGRSYVFVGEIGDNGARYYSVFVYRFEEPALVDTILPIRSIDKIEIRYEDGPRDAEALFVDPKSGDIYIISKREEKVGLYQIAYPQSFKDVNTAKKVATLPMTMVTAADISPNGKYIMVKTYTGVVRYSRSGKTTIAKAMGKKPKPMPYKIEPQGEAIGWGYDGKGYFCISERSGEQPLILYYYK